MDTGKKKTGEILWYLLVLIFMYIWFTQVHPLVIFDADDWTYLIPTRRAWPIWGEWNPAKVLPEVFMPLCSAVGNFLLTPLVGDFVKAMTMTHAFVVSVFITVYVYSFAQLMKRLFQLPTLDTIYACALFLIFHFLAMRSEEADNLYLFYCKDVNCYYNYLIPGLLNASIIMWMVKNEKFENFLSNGNAGVKGIFYLVLYMAIFSNLVDSVILAVYAGAYLLVDFIKQMKGLHLKAYLKEHLFPICIFVVWLVSAVFELSGGRAGESGSSSGLYALKESAYCLFDVLRNGNGLFLIVCTGIIVLAAVLFIQARKQDKEFLDLSILWFICAAAMVVCMVVLCAMVRATYLYRVEYLFGIFFYCITFVMLCFGYVVHKQPKVLLVLPILLCVMASETDTKERTFQESNASNLDPAVCTDISRDLIDQVVVANEAGMKEMTLYVPVWDSEDNWPHALQLIPRIRHALYTYRILDYPVEVTVVPSTELNEKYNLSIPAPIATITK